MSAKSVGVLIEPIPVDVRAEPGRSMRFPGALPLARLRGHVARGFVIAGRRISTRAAAGTGLPQHHHFNLLEEDPPPDLLYLAGVFRVHKTDLAHRWDPRDWLGVDPIINVVLACRLAYNVSPMLTQEVRD